jgi:hypothetical protein
MYGQEAKRAVNSHSFVPTSNRRPPPEDAQTKYMLRAAICMHVSIRTILRGFGQGKEK